LSFKLEPAKLKELGFLNNEDQILVIKEESWKRVGIYYTSRMRIGLRNGKSKELILKCPWDVVSELLDASFVTMDKRGKIESYVDAQVKLGKELEKIGVSVLRVEKYDNGTLVQEHLAGRKLEEFLNEAPHS